ncbi:2-hydroxyacylsphingosine 1-beta-galactosyltransferase-like [Chiloscyllium plagiosum]|uniref:2-hydroxyacylsphingosine 1-beta-galactosyltransferase-like n=1 Tax=Chiloscyllium plagiosum TaxID=36176 RepID=UPI001CB85CA4|nr:2-hydroxyacylsphingosine 1-beta-galactosyltransferase-like [Chiloscyllium plagiosum]XP_043534995.1 2-hydroxyacylsphingosine 1-beta-galactosyltransferase-like [Chiloscyllium plagiosum]
MKLLFFTIPLFILTLTILKSSIAAKIMVIPPIMFESHLQIFKTLAKALHGQGHEVVIVASKGREIEESPYYRFQKYPGLFTSQTADDFLQEKMKNIFSGKFTALELFGILDSYTANCDQMLGNRDLENRLREEQFDLLLVDPNEMCGYVFAEILGVKHVTFSTGLWFPAELGAPSPVSYVPEFNSLMTDRMSFLERAWNSLIYVVSRVGTRCAVLPKYDAILQKYRAKPSRSMLEVVQASSVFLLCTDIALEFPRPSLPNIVFVGGILTRHAHPLLEDLATWVEGAPDGVVVVSFGAGVKYLSDNLTEKLAAAFARLPQKVLWRFFGKRPSSLGNNTKLMEWIPQNDLLGHPNVKAFLSHGGLNGIYESIYHGIPVVGIPFFGDHYDIMTRVHAKGMGIFLSWKAMTEEDIYQAIITVTMDPRYKAQAMYLSKLHHDQPLHPVNRTIYWLDYVLRHNGAAHLRPSMYDMFFYQYYMLDVIAVFAVCTILFGYCFLKMVKKLKGSVLPKVKSSHTQNGIPNRKMASESKKRK